MDRLAQPGIGAEGAVARVGAIAALEVPPHHPVVGHPAVHAGQQQFSGLGAGQPADASPASMLTSVQACSHRTGTPTAAPIPPRPGGSSRRGRPPRGRHRGDHPAHTPRCRRSRATRRSLSRPGRRSRASPSGSLTVGCSPAGQRDCAGRGLARPAPIRPGSPGRPWDRHPANGTKSS